MSQWCQKKRQSQILIRTRGNSLSECECLCHNATVIITSATTTDPNLFGEMLREYAFLEKTGAYSCFDLKPEFKKVDKSSDLGQALLSALGWGLPSSTDASSPLSESEEVFLRSSLYSNGSVHIAWHWDGDGHLVIVESGRAAENTDCKKSGGWRWINWSL